MKTMIVLAVFSLAACDEAVPPPAYDFSVRFDLAGQPDAAVPEDLTAPVVDQSVPPGDSAGPMDAASSNPDFATPQDGQLCGNGCPAGTTAVDDQTGVCHCWIKCTVSQANACPSGRSCRPLYVMTDMGWQPTNTGACIPGNGPGERCGKDQSGNLYGWGGCLDGTLCVQEDVAGKYSYCFYKCAVQGDCPAGTTCTMLVNPGQGSVCALNTAADGKAIGEMCSLGSGGTKGTNCAIGAGCDGSKCTTACNGPKDQTTCGGQKCTPQVDPNNQRISAYLCK